MIKCIKCGLYEKQVIELTEDLETTAQLNVLLLQYAPQDIRDGVEKIFRDKIDAEVNTESV
jgi:hypothetical protein